MKIFKKSISIILCVITIFSCFALSAAAVESDNDRLPVVYISGYESLSIYFKDDPNKTMLFPANFDIIMSNLKNFGEYSKESLENKDPHIISNSIYSIFYDSLGMTALKPDGITNADDRITTETSEFCRDADGRYYFEYDCRLSPIDLAKRLHKFIKKVQKDSGSKRFELVGASYGTTVLMTYLNEYPEMHKYIDSVLISVPSYGGFSVMGEIYSGNFHVNHDTLTQYAYVGLDNPDLGLFLSVLNKSGLLKILLEYMLLPALRAALVDLSKEVIHDTIGTIPSIWTFVPADYFYASIERIYGENYRDKDHEYAGLISKLLYYHENIQQRLDVIYNTARKNGIEMNIICKYGRPPMPISKKGSFMSDGAVDVTDVTLGAVASKYNETLPEDYKQVRYKKYNFMSPDRCIDASTGIHPLHTWYVRGLEHSVKNAGFEELIDHILYNNPNVFSDDKFPQYTYATPDGGLAPVVGVEEKHETTLMQDFIALNKRIFELASTAIKEKIGK